MTNKIYEKSKKILKENIKTILSFILVVICLTMPLPYYIYTNGGTINITDRINLENSNKKLNGSFNLAYVEELRATVPTYLLSYILPDWKLESISSYTASEQEEAKDVIKRDKLYLENANSAAIKVAYTLANKDFKIKSVFNNVIYVSPEAKTNIKIGDIIIKINNNDIKDINEFKKVIEKSSIGDKILVTVKRNNKIKDAYIYVQNIDGEKMTGLSILTTYDYETKPKISMEFKEKESGSSGGFTTALAIYSKLIDEDIIKGRNIVGTGTIDESGNVGEIGGVTYKLKGAVKSKADIFFVPSGNNYNEVMKYNKKKKYKIKIVPVKNIKDAIKYLQK